MKKLFTILFSFGMMATAFAQSHDRTNRGHSGGPVIIVKPDSRDVYGNNNHRYDDAYNLRELNAQKHRINLLYDAKIRNVRNNRWMRASQKSRQIRMLEIERMEQLRIVSARYSRGNNRYDDHYGKGDSRKW